MNKPKYQYVIMPWQAGNELIANLKNQKFTSYHAVIDALVAQGFKVEPVGSASLPATQLLFINCFQLHNGKVVAYPSIYLKVSSK